MANGHARNLMEFRILVVALLQLVIGDTRAQMVDVVEADVTANPLEGFG
jgi:hypothetical protein